MINEFCIKVIYNLINLGPRIKKKLFIHKEIIKIKFSSKPKWTILISKRPDSEIKIRKAFKRINQFIHFDNLNFYNITIYDLVVPLSITDLRFLNNHKELIQHNPLPIPSMEVINLCNDKVLFQQFMEKFGFAAYTPKCSGQLSFPVIIKKREAEYSVGSEIIYDRNNFIKYKKLIQEEDYFIQEFIPGKKEYSTHLLFIDNKIHKSLTLQYKYEKSIHIHGKDEVLFTKVVSCPYLKIFAAILSSIEFVGICCIDYKVYKGKLIIFEINPFIGTSLAEFLFSFIYELNEAC